MCIQWDGKGQGKRLTHHWHIPGSPGSWRAHVWLFTYDHSLPSFHCSHHHQLSQLNWSFPIGHCSKCSHKILSPLSKKKHLLRRPISQAQVVQCEARSHILLGFPKCPFASYQGLSAPAGDGTAPLLSSPFGQAATPEGCTAEYPFLSCAEGESVDPFLSLSSRHGFFVIVKPESLLTQGEINAAWKWPIIFHAVKCKDNPYALASYSLYKIFFVETQLF